MSRDHEQLLKKAIRFLEMEREVYGEFSVKRSMDSVVSAAPSSGSVQTLSERLKTCSTLDELRELCSVILREQGMSESPSENPMVFGSGHEKADLMLIAHTPGAEDLQTGVPFSGEAGRLLDKILAAIHFRREDLYLTHLIKHRVPEVRGRDTEDRELNVLRQKEFQAHLLILERQIELIDPGLILCLGRQAAAALITLEDPPEDSMRRSGDDSTRPAVMKCWSLIILRSCWTIRSGSVRPGRMCSCCGAGTMSDSPADPESLMRSFLTFCIHILYHRTDSADHFELPVTPSALLSA